MDEVTLIWRTNMMYDMMYNMMYNVKRVTVKQLQNSRIYHANGYHAPVN